VGHDEITNNAGSGNTTLNYYEVNEAPEPKRCPICEGRGRLAGDFYDEHEESTAVVAWVKCRTCGGTGIVWPPSVETAPRLEPTPAQWPPVDCPWTCPPLWLVPQWPYAPTWSWDSTTGTGGSQSHG